MSEETKDDNPHPLGEFAKIFNDAMNEIEKESEEYWNSLSKEDQLKVFCAVSRRIYQGELEEKRSYRGVLYGTFGFGPEAYGRAQMSGYLSIHNAIMDDEHDTRLVDNCVKWINDNVGLIDEEAKQKLKEHLFL